MKFETIQAQTSEKGVLTVVLNRPDVRNAFNDQVIDELTQVFTKEVKAPGVRMVLLKGQGSVFCAGGDLNWMKTAVDWSYKKNLADTQKLARLFASMNECPKPMVGLVHGAAIGGGVGLVSVCDIVVASSETVFSLSEVRLGLIPACIGPFVLAKIGASQCRALFISAERFDSKKAQGIGLIHEIVNTPSELDMKAQEISDRILQCGPGAVAAAKKLVLDLSWPEYRVKQKNCLDTVAKVLAELRVSPEGQEGVRAFLDKRSPDWNATVVKKKKKK